MSENNDKIKDLLIKLQILTNGLLEERKKSTTYLEKIKDLEKLLQKKDNEVVELTKQKFDLQAALTFEKSKNQKIEENGKKKNFDEKQITHYENIINEQGFRLKDLNCKLANEKVNFKAQIEQYKIFLEKQNGQLLDYKKKYEKANEENKSLTERNDELKKENEDLKVDNLGYKKKFGEYQNDKIKVQNKNVELQNQLDELRKENFEKEEEIKNLKNNNQNMGVQLNEMKNNLLNKKLNKKSFKAEIFKTKKIIEIIFQQNKEEEKDKYEMIIKGKSKKDEIINLLDINQFEINDKDKTRIDIEYTVRIINI